jgi:hypothetical protein
MLVDLGNMLRETVIFGLALAAVGCAKPDPPFPDAKQPDAAAETAVDRFDPSFATLFNRDAPIFNPSVVSGILPDANAPIDMDAHFLGFGLGPKGEKVTYYALDISPAAPSRAFTVHGVDGALIEGQLPIMESVPGDEGYNDFMWVQEVHVGDKYIPNQLTSVAEIEDMAERGVAVLVDNRRVANWAAVPAGTTADRTFDGEPVSGFRAWRNGEIVHFLNFDRQLVIGDDGNAPASNISVIFADGMSPAEGFATEADGQQTHNVFETLPGDDGYSSLWAHQVGRLDGFDTVTNWATANANFQEKLDIAVNCPIVAE